VSPGFSRIMVSVLLKKASALETCTFLHSCFPSVVVIFYSSIHSFLLLVLEAIVMRMCYLKKNHLAKMVCKHLF
jgi:hypothetical protein